MVTKIRHLFLITLPIAIMIIIALLASSFLATESSLQAQGENLLQNPGFDGAMSGTVPSSWQKWGDADSDRETLSILRRSSPNSWRLRKEYGIQTAGGYQTVTAQAGNTYRFSIYATIWTCNDTEFSCRDANSTWSDTSSGGRVRVGIDPAGGTDPYSANIQWSGFKSPFTFGQFESLAVEATATAGQVTVFTYYTADQVMRWHDVFWDDASLVVTATGGNSGGNNGGNSGGNSGGNPQPQNTAVPVSVDPTTRADGSKVHVVQSGQNLSVIASAYGLTVNQLMAMNGLSDTLIRVGQQLIVSTAPPPTATSQPTIQLQSTTVTPFGSSNDPNATEEVAQILPTLAEVNVDANNNEETSDSKQGVAFVAIAVIVIGIVTVGGLAIFMGYIMLHPRP